MIGIALIVGAAIVGATLVARYWNKILDFMKKVIKKLSAKLSANSKIMGTANYIRKVGNKFQNRTKYYSKNEEGKWKETVVTYEQTESEIPEEYRSMLRKMMNMILHLNWSYN